MNSMIPIVVGSPSHARFSLLQGRILVAQTLVLRSGATTDGPTDSFLPLSKIQVSTRTIKSSSGIERILQRGRAGARSFAVFTDSDHCFTADSALL
jgi:hypothetical protein